eukprot:UN11688
MKVPEGFTADPYAMNRRSTGKGGHVKNQFSIGSIGQHKPSTSDMLEYYGPQRNHIHSLNSTDDLAQLRSKRP